MKDCIARLIKCGMPRDVAVCICKTFMRDNNLYALQQYVESVEEETKYKEWEEW